MNDIGVWILSIIATLVLPCLPLCIEWLRFSHVKNDTITITAAVLAAGFIFSSEHVLYLCAYIFLFLGNLLLNMAIGPDSPSGVGQWSGTLLLAVGFLHISERFWWHVVLSRPFPEGFSLGRRIQGIGGQP